MSILNNGICERCGKAHPGTLLVTIDGFRQRLCILHALSAAGDRLRTGHYTLQVKKVTS